MKILHCYIYIKKNIFASAKNTKSVEELRNYPNKIENLILQIRIIGEEKLLKKEKYF